MYDGKNQSTEVLKRWRIPGQITNVPKANFNIKNSTYFVEDGSYLRVKDISLSYNIRCRQFKKWGISRVQPYFTASNLLTWTSYSGMDPEVNQYGLSLIHIFSHYRYVSFLPHPRFFLSTAVVRKEHCCGKISF